MWGRIRKAKLEIYETMNKLLILFILVAVLAVGYRLSSQGSAEIFEIVLTETGFEPAELSVPVGSRIVFKTTTGKPYWPASDPHPLHEKYPVFDAKKPIKPDEDWTFRTGKVGEWGFHDHLFFTHRGKLTVVSKKDWDKENKVLTRQDMSKMIEKVGPGEAFKSLKKISDAGLVSTHSIFHIFGEVLYDKSGVSGISVCDEFAGFACYHGFFIAALSNAHMSSSEDVIKAVQELDQECVKKFGLMGLGCPHGIGHGLVEFLGYDKLSEALSICTKLSWQGPLFGCQGGVLMEYNFRTVFRDDESTVTVREAHGNLYEPCRSVAPRFRQACYFEQASWWLQVLNSDEEKVGSLCQGIINKSEKEACFLGLGTTVTERSGYNRDKIINSCSQMSDPYSEAICRTGGAWAFFANPEKVNQSEEICEGLGTYQKLCLEKRILVN